MNPALEIHSFRNAVDEPTVTINCKAIVHAGLSTTNGPREVADPGMGPRPMFWDLILAGLNGGFTFL